MTNRDSWKARGAYVSNANYANATIDHLRGEQALEEAATIAESCVRDECSPQFVANRIRRPPVDEELVTLAPA